MSLPTLAVATLATVPRGFPRKGSRPSIGAQLTWRGAGPWVVLIALLTAWEIVAYVGTSRADHPTLSSIFGRLLDDRPGRAALMVAWLVLGWALFVRRSKASSDRGGS